MTSSKSLYKAIPALRGTICLLTLGCFITLFSYPKSPQDPFHILQQLGLNVCILFAYTYSLFGNSPRPLYPVYRMSLICTAFILSWVYGMGPLVRILGNQGCGATVYENAPGRCKMQVGVSSASVVWTVLMFCEGLMTDKRNRDKWYREQMGWEVVDDDHVLASRATARENAAATFGVVEYQPDLSLDGTVAGAGPGGPGGASRRRRAVDGDDEDGADLEMEPLPPYMPKARSNQPVIVDLSNLSPTSSLPYQQIQQQQQQQQPGDSNSNVVLQEQPSSSHQERGQGESQSQQANPIVSDVAAAASTSISPPSPTQLPPLQQGQQQQSSQEQQHHHVDIHSRGGPGTGLPRVPSYSSSA